MRRFPVATAALALALAGCPLPQPLPTYPVGTITPPRILASSTTSGVNSIVLVPAGCATAPTIRLDADIFFQASVTVGERVEARWFVDYKSDVAARRAILNPDRDVPANPDLTILERKVPTFEFEPYGFAPPEELGSYASSSSPGVVHVVELVVSNGFATDDPQQPNRAPGTTADGVSQFEIQTYRWTFVNVPENPAASCSAGEVGCPKCLP